MSSDESKPLTQTCKFGNCRVGFTSERGFKHGFDDVYSQLDEHAREKHYSSDKMATRLVWLCGQQGCPWYIFLGTTANDGICELQKHTDTHHKSKYVPPSLQEMTASQRKAQTTTWRGHLRAQRAHAQPQSSQSHTSRSHTLQSQSQPTPISHDAFPSELMHKVVLLGTHHCKLSPECLLGYDSEEQAGLCSEWHLKTGCLARELPFGHLASSPPLAHFPDKPLYVDIKGPGNQGEHECTYTGCGRRYTIWRSAYHCRRWHRYTGRLVTQVRGHHPEAAAPYVVRDPAAPRGDLTRPGLVQCSHAPCQRRHATQHHANQCEQWHFASGRTDPNSDL